MARYSIRVLEIGFGTDVPAGFYLGDFADPELTYPIHPFSMTLVQGEGKNILIDTGIDMDDPVKQEIIKMAGIGNTHSPKEILTTVGLTPEDIDEVILTHAHFDHAGGLDCYPNATFYIQKKEYRGWTEYVSDPKFSAVGLLGFDANDLKRLQKLEQEGRLVLLDGDVKDLFPGISVMQAAFGHTYGHQMVLIESDGTLFVHVGDVANRPENLKGTEKFPFFIPNVKFSVGSPYYAIMDYERLMKWTAGNVEKIIMTHDGSRRERYPDSIGPLGLGIFRIC
ncbi:MAG: N-acyl homoserine lactonase family protein [Lachnospiraceae bacterium]|jgi:N-acyl homoserine lactone hydrolase